MNTIANDRVRSVPNDPLGDLLRRVRRIWEGETPSTYVLTRWLFLRALGLVYLIAFLSLAVQIAGLVGPDGVLPVGAFLRGVHASYGAGAYHLLPTLAWLSGGAGFLRFLCWGGAALAVLLVAGIAPIPILALLWAFYLSLTVAGQVFLNFQWDALLLETGLVAVLWAPPGWRPRLSDVPRPSTAARWLVWWLLFRLMFLSGITKLASGDPTWAHWTALDYHFWTQPLPTWTAWYAAWLPHWTHRAATGVMMVVELIVPFLILVPHRLRRLRPLACGLLIALQLGIAGTGNYGFFNLLAIVLCLTLLDDTALLRLLPRSIRNRLAAVVEGVSRRRRESKLKRAVIGAAAAVILTVSSLVFVREIVYSRPSAAASGRWSWIGTLTGWAEPFRSINGYGLFRVMTTRRPEIVIEGSRDGRDWKTYAFRWKAGDVRRRPRFVEPHMPRLDWQMWFAALNPPGAQGWLVPLVRRLLEGSPAVLGLLDGNPFPDAPPRYIRLVYYQYRFATPAERRATGAWWTRERQGDLTPPLTLVNGELRVGRLPAPH